MNATSSVQSLCGWFALFILSGLAGRAAEYATPYTFTTLAGTSTFGSTDGVGSGARFAWPQGLALDGAGNMYVADADNSTLRKVTPAGLVTTVAGKAGYYETVDGTGSEARFNFPFGVAIDHAGNIFVAELGGHVIRKVSSGGTVTTFAGLAGVSGTADGTGSAARFNAPFGMAVDSADNLYVAEMGNHDIRKITPGGVVSTYAGLAGASGSEDGTRSTARFMSPNYLTIDPAGTFYVSDTGNHTIRKISPAGNVTTLAGTAGVWGYADGTGPAASFKNPQGIALDAAGNIILSDQVNHVIRKITPAGVVTTLAGSVDIFGSADGSGTTARFRELSGLVSDAAGNLFGVDSVDCTVRKISPAGDVTTLAGLGLDYTTGSTDGAASAARFNALGGTAVGPAGDVFAADPLNSTIRRIAPNGIVSTLAGSAGHAGSVNGAGSAARFQVPSGVATDHAGTVYVADSGNHTIRRISATGDVTTLAGTAGVFGSVDGTGAAARFSNPYAIAVDSAGTIYVGELGNYTIRKISPAGDVTTLAGLAGISGNADGQGSAARFSRPESIAVDAAGIVYVADTGNNVIRKIAPNGTVTTLAATVGYTGRLTVDNAGNLFIAGLTISKVAPDGTISTLAGLFQAVGSADGTGSEARFNNPQGIALDGAGSLYVTSDTTLRKGQLAGPPTITTHPLSQTVAPGAAVQFSVTASGVAPLAYQWQFNGSPFVGATASSLSFANARSSDAGDYTVVVSNGSGAVTSNKATLTVSAISPPPPTSSSSGSGGGATGGWFIAALLMLTAIRAATAHRKQATPPTL